MSGGIGMRRLTGKDSVSLQAMIPSKRPRCRCPSPFWAGASCSSWLSHGFPAYLGGEEQGPESKLCSKPGLTRKEQAGLNPSGPPAMRLLWGLIWASGFFALSLQKPRSWRQDAESLDRARADEGKWAPRGPDSGRAGGWLLTRTCSSQVAPLCSFWFAWGSPCLCVKLQDLSFRTGGERIRVPEEPITR